MCGIEDVWSPLVYIGIGHLGGTLKALHIYDATTCVRDALVTVDGSTYLRTERTVIEFSASDLKARYIHDFGTRDNTSPVLRGSNEGVE